MLGGLHKRGPKIWTGGAMDALPVADKAVIVDVRSLPEHDMPTTTQVNVFMRQIDRAVKHGDNVLIKCRAGISRSPTVAHLYLIGRGESFDRTGSMPNRAYQEFYRQHEGYYKQRRWLA